MDKKPDNDKRDDELLDEYLDGNTQLSKSYRDIGEPEPPAALDRAILDQAKAAADPAGEGHQLEFWKQWLRPLSAALTMAICLGVILEFMSSTSGDITISPELQATLEADNLELRRDADSRVAAPPPAAKAEVEQLAQFDSVGPEATLSMGAPVQKPAREEMMVTARKQMETLQDVPQAMSAPAVSEPSASSLRESASTGVEEITVATRKRVEEPDGTLAENALEAWDAGARPTAGVWLAGIETLLDYDMSELAEQELERMALVYPDAAADFTGDTKRRELMNIMPELDREASTYKPPTDRLATANVWMAGITWLFETGEDAALEAELEKFRRIYPFYEGSRPQPWSEQGPE